MIETIIGCGRDSEIMLKTLDKSGNLVIGVKRYKNLIKKYGSEENFLLALRKKFKRKYSIRYVDPSIHEFNNKIRDTKEKDDFYVIEEI